ncbi:DUF1415 domain-containing protein [Ramlibacter sp. MMS24-I3-19]|uniref:DUF1415 domain-containing protein n=1 Tax=Ramlibacter sp. MMS24-I3-19 TaxID=3416606 RepID=UPI003D07F31B
MPLAASDQVIADTRRWLERAVIGLNLCPFAKAVHVRQQVHFAVCGSPDFAEILQALDDELDALLGLPASVRDTTLLMLPGGFDEFLLFQQLIAEGDRRIARRGLEGTVQLAHFHPEFRFAHVEEDDPGNYSNRSPYPTLHLLREDSIDRAVAAMPDAEAIFGANIERLRSLGPAGWAALHVGRST